MAGSVALGAYRPNRSDIDIVAVIGDDWRDRRDLIVRLRLLHLSQLPRLALRAARGRGFSACCNVSFIWKSDLTRPVTGIRPIASHTGEIFEANRAFDVNPVVWKELVDGGIVVRGRALPSGASTRTRIDCVHGSRTICESTGLPWRLGSALGRYGVFGLWSAAFSRPRGDSPPAPSCGACSAPPACTTR